ncbi:MAG: CidA/LrgA family protein [Gammaproteobacteria bacterium]
MLASIFIIFLFQLIGEMLQKYFELTIPGPVIGLVLLLVALLLHGRYSKSSPGELETGLNRTSDYLLGHLPLLFVPIGVGVVMHISFLEDRLLSVLLVIFIGTVLTVGFTAFVMEKLQTRGGRHDG